MTVHLVIMGVRKDGGKAGWNCPQGIPGSLGFHRSFKKYLTSWLIEVEKIQLIFHYLFAFLSFFFFCSFSLCPLASFVYFFVLSFCLSLLFFLDFTFLAGCVCLLELLRWLSGCWPWVLPVHADPQTVILIVARSVLMGPSKTWSHDWCDVCFLLLINGVRMC